MGRRHPRDAGSRSERDGSGSRTGSEAGEAGTGSPAAVEGLSLERREWLAAIGALAGGSAVATRSARAEEGGYGAGGYGSEGYGDPTGDDGIDRSLAVATGGVTDVSETSATLGGELTELTGYESAAARLEWGESTGSVTNATGERTLESPGAFAAEVTGLESGTEYEFYAYAEADGYSASGETVSFVTDGSGAVPEADPRISRLNAEDTGNPKNPHVDASIDWAATIDEGELDAAELSVSDSNGEVFSRQYDLSGQTAERSETKRIKHGSRETYTVELHVHSAHGTVESETDSV